MDRATEQRKVWSAAERPTTADALAADTCLAFHDDRQTTSRPGCNLRAACEVVCAP